MIELKKLAKEDEKKAIQFAINGMHFDWYMDSPLLLNLYGTYFWYLEQSRATDTIAAYVNGQFTGVLLAEMKGQKPAQLSPWKKAYVRLFDWLQKTFAKDGVGPYDEANQKMLADLEKWQSLDGEIIFLAADPDSPVKGVGSRLLAELENRYPGKRVFLYTDSGCTYQFYDRRGFERLGQEAITLELGKKQVDLDCFLYSKVLGKKTSKQ